MPKSSSTRYWARSTLSEFAHKVIAWARDHGRTDLPWQQDRTPYRVWLSEIMLQQTQVETVRDYFLRFTAKFPSIRHLARAQDDEVMALWAGLGYYSRARNLLRAARHCLNHHDGDLPESAEDLEALPGIGRSTAAAIISQAHDQPAAILDANAKRVIARYQGIEGWPGKSSINQSLWQAAEALLPMTDGCAYTQGLMDLGATVCKPRAPRCADCPVSASCVAHIKQTAESIPAKKPRKPKPQRHLYLLVQTDEHGRIMLQRRPPTGIWGGLYSLPECEDLPPDGRVAESFKHQFSHFSLIMTPTLVESRSVGDNDSILAGPAEVARIGCPAPIGRWLKQYFAGEIQWQMKLNA